MTVTALALPAPTALHAPTRLGAVARRAGVNLGLACAVPAAVFYVLFSVAGVWTAMVAVLVWSYGTLGWRALTGRRTSGLLVLTTVVLTCRTLIALAASSPFIYFLQPDPDRLPDRDGVPGLAGRGPPARRPPGR